MNNTGMYTVIAMCAWSFARGRKDFLLKPVFIYDLYRRKKKHTHIRHHLCKQKAKL